MIQLVINETIRYNVKIMYEFSNGSFFMIVSIVLGIAPEKKYKSKECFPIKEMILLCLIFFDTNVIIARLRIIAVAPNRLHLPLRPKHNNPELFHEYIISDANTRNMTARVIGLLT